MTITLDQRVAALETSYEQILSELKELKAGQATAATEQTLQTANLLALSMTLNKLQSAIQRWGAAAALIGAVALFLASKALGLG